MRLINFQKELTKNSLSGALISDTDNIFYLSGHLIEGGCGPALLFVPADGEPVLAVSEYDANLPSCKNFPGRIISFPTGEPGVISTADAAEVMVRRCRGFLKSPVGIEAGSLSLEDASILMVTENGAWKDVGSLIRALRSVKSADEITRLRLACRAADAGQAKAEEIFSTGISEISLQTECRCAMEIVAGRPIDCKADVLIGKKTVLIGGPTGIADETSAAEGEPAIVDLLPRVGGYYADTTRTLWSGQPSVEKKEVIDFLISVKNHLEKMLVPGAEAAAIDSVARERLLKAGSFPHHTGHGIGISSNEAPYLTPGSGDVLQEGMTITLEPGLYFDTWGARIEDDYLITADGYEKLTGLYS
jgi:Xaa-Pro dipeptidase